MDDMDALLDQAEKQFEAWATEQRLPMVAWSLTKRTWLAGFEAAIEAMREGDDSD